MLLVGRNWRFDWKKFDGTGTERCLNPKTMKSDKRQDTYGNFDLQ